MTYVSFYVLFFIKKKNNNDNFIQEIYANKPKKIYNGREKGHEPRLWT